ncbi:uncharacterized protein [Aegilops tauschii subsp. strangulata]|uniref:uncharacterized protein n=1 Tax=Aegilops tauschii subsp. strangulata TaxID=200361 RepID=UPI0008440658|nr:ethylene-responsive transcription factor RAP2-12-like [Aegilops tauschii subsp. strangulata]
MLPKASFKGVRPWTSGRSGVEFQHVSWLYWLDTFRMWELAAHAYDIAAWRLEMPRGKLNFPEFQLLKKAEFVGPKVIIVSHPTKSKTPIVVEERGDIWESDAEMMARFAAEHPEYVQYEYEWYWKRDMELKKGKNNDEAGPSSQVVKVEYNVDDIQPEDKGSDIEWDSIDND